MVWARLRCPSCDFAPKCVPVESGVSSSTKAGQLPKARRHILFPAIDDVDDGLCEHGTDCPEGASRHPLCSIKGLAGGAYRCLCDHPDVTYAAPDRRRRAADTRSRMQRLGGLRWYPTDECSPCQHHGSRGPAGVQGPGSIYRLDLDVASQQPAMRHQGDRRERHSYPRRGSGDGDSDRDPDCGLGMQRSRKSCRHWALPLVRYAGPACTIASGLIRSSNGARGWAAWPPALSARPKARGVPAHPRGRWVESCMELPCLAGSLNSRPVVAGLNARFPHLV